VHSMSDIWPGVLLDQGAVDLAFHIQIALGTDEAGDELVRQEVRRV
jgi:hypothetical protein